MCKIIAIANQKGGVGKTTTTSNLGIGLAKQGKKVLLIDADAQGSLTASLGFTEPDSLEVTLATIMGNLINDGEVEPGEGILHHEEGIDLMPGNIELSGLEVSLVNVMSRETVLRSYIEIVRENYDYILIDCMPSLGMITINAFASADSILIPVQAAYLPVKGLQQLIKTVGKVKRQINPKLEIEGILLTMVDSRTNYAKDISAMLKEAYGSRVRIFANVIPISVRAAEISAEGVSIYKHDPKGKVASAYDSLTKEVITSARQGDSHFAPQSKEVAQMGSNAKPRSASKVALESFDDLFGGSAAQESGVEQIINAPLAELYTFKDHPFRVEDDEKMEETTESIRQYGVLVPGIARPRAGGGYEIIAGHRRKRGSELAGKTEMPVVVRNYTDDEATIIMVDSNIQREDILPSEKARAYKMKYEAMKHQGKKSGRNTLDEVGEAAGENAKKVQRYIWLSRLTDELLAMVDGKKLGFSQGVDISFLAEEAQQWVQAVIEEKGCNVSMVQSAKIKEYGKTGELTLAMVRLILTEEKPKERKVTLKADKISEYFAEDCSSEEIEGIIIQLLDEWKKRQ